MSGPCQRIETPGHTLGMTLTIRQRIKKEGVNLCPMEHHQSHIERLRGIAILAVVGYHAGLPGFGGGFVGVDVFFVVSGYLITGQLVRLKDARKLDLQGFWLRRLTLSLIHI